MDIREIPICDVVVAPGRRPTDAEKVKSLATSIKAIGLLSPILVNEDRRLIAGRHRLEAGELLGWKSIPAHVLNLSDMQAQLAEIDENIERNALTALEYSIALKRRKELYEALHPETKPGIAGGKASGAARGKNEQAHGVRSFVSDTAAKTGAAIRTVQSDIAIAEHLDDDAAEAIADTPIADNKAELKRLGQLPAKEQRQAAKKIKAGKAATVEEATKLKQQDQSTDDKMKAANSILEGLAHRISQIIKDAEEIDNPHLRDERCGRMTTAAAQLRSAANTIRSAKGAGLCTYCDGGNKTPMKGCRACMGTGWLTKPALESAPEVKR